MGGSAYSMAPSFQSQQQTQTRDPWAAAIPALNTTLQGAQNAFDTTYNGPNVAGMDANVTGAQNAILANSAGGAVTGASQSALGGVRSILDNLGLSGQQSAGAGAISGALGNLSPMASGAMLDPRNDPNFQKSLQDSLDQSANTVNAQFSQAGRYGSGAQTDTLARTLGNVATNAYSNRYAQNEQNMLSANAQTGSLAGQLAGIGQSSIGNLYGAGDTLQGLGTAQTSTPTRRARSAGIAWTTSNSLSMRQTKARGRRSGTLRRSHRASAAWAARRTRPGRRSACSQCKITNRLPCKASLAACGRCRRSCAVLQAVRRAIERRYRAHRPHRRRPKYLRLQLSFGRAT